MATQVEADFKAISEVDIDQVWQELEAHAPFRNMDIERKLRVVKKEVERRKQDAWIKRYNIEPEHTQPAVPAEDTDKKPKGIIAELEAKIRQIERQNT